MAKLPSFSELKKYYSDNSISAYAFLDSLFPKYKNNPSYQNTCTMRMCKPLNYIENHNITEKSGMHTIIGTDKKRYGIRVREMIPYLNRKYLAPNIQVTGINGYIDVAKFKNRRGIICFEVTGWNDATGHFTLWDGNNILYGQHDYFNLPSEGKGAKVTKAYLWEC